MIEILLEVYNSKLWSIKIYDQHQLHGSSYNNLFSVFNMVFVEFRECKILNPNNESPYLDEIQNTEI